MSDDFKMALAQLGVVLGCFLFGVSAPRAYNHLFPDPRDGNWALFFLSDSSALELDKSTFVRTESGITVRVKEHRVDEFQSAYVTGNTVISKLTVDCEHSSIILHSQTSYTSDMTEREHRSVDLHTITPVDSMTHKTYLFMCVPDLSPPPDAVVDNFFSVRRKKQSQV